MLHTEQGFEQAFLLRAKLGGQKGFASVNKYKFFGFVRGNKMVANIGAIDRNGSGK